MSTKIEMLAIEYRGIKYTLENVGGDMYRPVGIPYPIPPYESLRIVCNRPFPLSAFVTKEEIANMFLELRDFGKGAGS